MLKNSIVKKLLFLILLCVAPVAKAEIKLPALFGDHMVLQQQSNTSIWGSASPGHLVEIKTSWDDKTYKTHADLRGDWRLKIRTPAAGGPYSITISDERTLTLSDVLIGEVWLCSGQSNMFMTLKGNINQPVLGSNKAIATSTNPSLRFFTVERNASLKRLEDFNGEWQNSTPGTAANFSATAYYFGKMLQEVLQVPVGLISSSWGGTAIEPWISEDGLKEFDWVPEPGLDAKGKLSQKIPSALFNAMIHPIIGYTIKGAIWYQGESNRKHPKKYGQLLPGLIANWRKELGLGDFPFYYAQIAPYDYATPGINSALLREAQYNTLKLTENTGMVCLMDIGEKNCIHPSNKQVGGERFAYQALAQTYEIPGIAYSGPVLKEMTIEGPAVRLTFDHAQHGLNTFGKALTNFKIAGKNKRFYPAHATINWQGITLFSAFVKEPVAVRYAFDDFVEGELFNTEGLPASSFRTDDWEIE
ncbi:sialate O-acetylesterase [Zobellia galactanivorans]|uniref:Sialate O-acetylesterase n=1 Tax=Zobellia galactanivorans (strain DSM 12802 / CCUG 47099 / CIP 106680 / NCIMB 13871 / Dsij) TaxID=63186 RepID=G0L160_ZOBGA|nr:sialate O-acetylesterase [Zobellia galactanivorans]CAZ97658.1 Sialate O-acetylesterase [Zobellia galactanivorans]